MSKYLTADFWKKLGFASKKDGENFAREIPSLETDLKKYCNDVDAFALQGRNVLAEKFKKFHREMRIYLERMRLLREETKSANQEIKKQAALLACESEVEKRVKVQVNAIVLVGNEDMHPVLGKDDINWNINEKFMACIKIKNILHPDAIADVRDLKGEVDAAYAILVEADKHLTKILKQHQ
jgi:hypothetical protein